MIVLKRICSFIFFLLILVILILLFNDNLRKDISLQKHKEKMSYLNEDFQYFTLAMAKKLDPEYEILFFDETIPDKDKWQISNKFYNIMDYTKRCFQNDHDFIYSIKNTKTNKIISNNINQDDFDDKSKYYFYSVMFYDENGDLKKEGNIHNESSSYFSLEKLLRIHYRMDSHSDFLNKIKINRPKNLEIIYIISKNKKVPNCFLIKLWIVGGLIIVLIGFRYIHVIKDYFKMFFMDVEDKLNMFIQIDLLIPINKMILKYVVINAGFIFILLVVLNNYIFIFVYLISTFFWLENKGMKIQKDYNRLLKAAQELGKGNFDMEIEADLGVFNQLEIEFNNIKDGFKKAVEEEIKSQNMKNELISNVSHDLKTPLTCIKNYIVLLQDDLLTEKTRHEYLNNLNLYVNRLTTLIEDFFEISKINSGNIQLNLMNLNIIALLEQTYTERKEILEAKNLILIRKYESTDIKLKLDGDKTYRIFENLFTNIAKYAMINSRGYLEVKDDVNKIVVEFKNISATQMNFTADEIVERFVRGDKSRHETGSGLGLAIAKSFTEVQGGEFKIDIDGDLFKTIICFKK